MSVSTPTVLDGFDQADDQDFANARRGYIASLPGAEIRNAKGQIVWTLAGYDFLKDPKPPTTVHPDLFMRLLDMMEEPDTMFNVVEP